MAIAPTRFSRVSIGWLSSNQSIVDRDPADTGAVFSVTGGVVFNGGATLQNISSGTASVDFGSVPAQDSSSVTVALAGAAVGDALTFNPGSNWSGSYYDLVLTGHVTAAGVVTLAAANSTITAVNPDASIFRLTALGTA